MKILIIEYITGGGCINEPLPGSLALEGNTMLMALVNDLAALEPVEQIIVPRDSRLACPDTQAQCTPIEWRWVNSAEQRDCVWDRAMLQCDAVWPIAPETGGILESVCIDIQRAGKILFNSPPRAVRLAASKKATAKQLEQHGIAVVPTFSLGPFDGEFLPPWVIKPDDGVGCEGSRVVDNQAELSKLKESAADLVIQPYLDGETVSLSVLFDRGNAQLLSCNRQYIRRSNGQFSLSGCLVNGVDDATGRFQRLAERIAKACPDLWGYAGIDLILNAGEPLVLEINPRLTTSYAGLREAAGINPAEMVLELLEDGGSRKVFETSVCKPVNIQIDGL